MTFKRGDQIMYVPLHVKERVDKNIACELTRKSMYLYDEDVQFGFVVGPCKDSRAVFCRYWNKTGTRSSFDDLRTKANSEITPVDSIYKCISTDQDVVDKILEEL